MGNGEDDTLQPLLILVQRTHAWMLIKDQVTTWRMLCSSSSTDEAYRTGANPQNLPAECTSSMRLNHLLHLIITAQKDAAPVMNMLRLHFHHPRHVAVDGLAAGVLKDHGHGLLARWWACISS
jgi:hypothetical protein